MYQYLNEKVADVDRRARRGEDILNPLTMSRVRIGDIIMVNYRGERYGGGRVIKASPVDVEVPMAGEYMVFHTEDAQEWHDAGYEVVIG